MNQKPAANIPKDDDKLYRPAFCARQPILDRKGGVWGYEVLFRDGLESRVAHIQDAEAATLQVSSCGFIRSLQDAGPTTKFCINFPERLILEGFPYALPPSVTVVEILESVRPTPSVLEAVCELKRNGYIVALDDFVWRPGYEELLEITDIIKVDFGELTVEKVRELMECLSWYSCMFLAEKVESEEVYRQALEMGFDLFQGYYFARPENLQARRLKPNEAFRFELLRLTESPDAGPGELAEAIQADVSISYRLLRYLNSAAFSFASEIKSVKQAVLILGIKQVRFWLRLVILAELTPAGKTPELAVLSMQRGRLLESLYPYLNLPYPPDGFFLLGLFSLLEAILETPMRDIVAGLPLMAKMKRALLREDPDLAQLLNLCESLEEGQWEEVDEFCSKWGVDLEIMKRCWSDSLVWSLKYAQGLQ